MLVPIYYILKLYQFAVLSAEQEYLVLIYVGANGVELWIFKYLNNFCNFVNNYDM